VIYYYVKPPISDLFVKNPQFNQKGFKMIAHIDQYFHSLGAINTLGYIFQLIDIMQGADEPVITLKARFSCLFALLKIGGVNIEPPLQVGFMPRSLLSTYHGVVKDFKLGRHPLTTATLQTVIDQCTSYDKDPLKGPVSKDGKPSRRSPANVMGASASPSGNNVHPFESMETLSFNKHLNHWRYNCKDDSDKCLICYNTSRDKDHSSKNCPILKRIGYKLVKIKRSASDTNAASRVGNDSTPSAPTPAPAPVTSPSDSGGLTLAPGAFTVATVADSYDSGTDFEYEGKDEGKLYVPSPTPNLARFLYSPIPPDLCP
jgi:hypothetical protein